MADKKTKKVSVSKTVVQQQQAAATSPTLLENLNTWGHKLLPVIFAAYVFFLILGVINHESWGDEAQSWLVVKDLDLTGLFKVLPSEGHPPLWYLVLFPFAKLGFPYPTVKWIAASIMALSLYLLLFKTKVNLLLKLAIPFSYYYFYMYAQFGRSYPLIVLLTVCLVMLYPRRFEKPWLFALCMIGLFNTHMLYFSFAFTLACLFIIDAIQLGKLNKQVIAAFIVMMLGGLYLIPYLSSSPIVEYSQNVTTNHVKNINLLLAHGLVPSGESVIIGALLMLGLIVSLINRTKVFLLLIGGIAGYIYIVAFRYNFIQPRHYGVMVFIIIGAFLFADFYKDDKLSFLFKNKLDLTKYGYMLCAVMLACQLHVSIVSYNYDREYVYSGSKEAAEFIVDNKLDKGVIIGYVPYAAVSIIPYLSDETKIYDATCQRYFRHYIYDECFTRPDTTKAGTIVQKAWQQFYSKDKDVTMIFNGIVDLSRVTYLDLIYKSPDVVLYPQETFFIYKFKKGLPKQ